MKIWFFSIYIVSILSSIAQNLVPNPSFEDFTTCPSNHTTQHEPIKTKHWFSASKGTPDLFSSCSLPIVSTPRNFAGIAYPPDGNNYVGLYFGNPTKTERSYREYLSVKLTQKLKEDASYQIEFFAKPATNSRYMIDRLGYAFSSDSIALDHDNELSHIQYNVIGVDTLEVINGWYKISTIYIANGTESYLTIGDFIPSGEGEYEKMIKMTYQLTGGRSVYYLFDNFSMFELNKPMEGFVTEQPFSLDKIYFQFDSFEINESGRDQLSKLASYLSSNPNLSLKIFGNTDSKGTVGYNNKLSKKRALAVKNVLIEFNIENSRLECYGMGEYESKYNLDSLNRRTEFLIVPTFKSRKQ